MKSASTFLRSLVLICLLAASLQGLCQVYTIDAGHTSFQTRVNRFGVVPVVGRFKDVSGEIIYDSARIGATKAELLIVADSYSANNIGGEEAIKSAAFLDVATHPEIRFKLRALRQEGDDLVAGGTLEIHGTKRDIQCPVSIIGPSIDLPTQKQSIGIMGELTIDRTEYGVGKEMKLPNGKTIIGNEVMIDFVILGIAKD